MNVETQAGESGPATTAPKRGFFASNPLDNLFARQSVAFYLFVAPWFIGFVAFTLGPFLISIVLSFTNWSIVEDPEFVGLSNFREMFREET